MLGFNKYRSIFLAAALLGSVVLPQAVMAATLTVMQSEGPRSMDPGDQSATFTNAIHDPMYEGLIGRNSALELVPSLATEWSADETGLIWTFKLREGVKFHDGTDFNAEAAVYNFNRHLDEARGLAASGRLRGFLASAEAVDANTIKLTLKSPYPAFLNMLTTNSSKMVSPTADAAGNLGAFSVGTGPYKLKEYKSGEYVLQEKNTDYWGTVNGEDEIKWLWTSEPSVLNMALQTGDADVINPVPPAFAKQIDSNPDLTLVQADGSAIFWVALNAETEELGDVRVRQALNFATDKDGIIQAIMAGYADPANSPLAKVAEGFDPELNPYPHDVAKAKALLAEAGFADGFEMSVVVQEPEARIAEVLQAMWAEIGVKLDVRRMESGVWSAAAFADEAGKKADGTDSVIASWSSGVNGPDLQLRPLYHSESSAPASANLGFYKSDVVDGLIDTAASTLDVTERNKIYGEAQKVINEDAPMVLLYVTKDLFAVRNGVEGEWAVPGGMIIVKDATKK